MNVSLSTKMREFVEDKLRRGEYESPEDVVEAGLESLAFRERIGDFDAGELDQLLARGESDIARGDVIDGEQVFREIDDWSAARRRDASK
jgi:antitoxin ParD1/3/4